ncbi:polysaccharide deacetylase family protein [Pendulispora brunnea]|uniref:Polysaccharide deacetylase family protein n=1 Tax=Pendulispora brunnea TaxID=2905690 RepID=A0ABZ2KA50_9BACT
MTSFRGWIPLLALAAGTWMGLGRPDIPRVRRYLDENSDKIEQLESTARSAARDATKVARDAIDRAGQPQQRRAAGPAPSLPPSPPLQPLSPIFSGLPDLLPWPRLNPDAGLNRAWLLAEGPDPDPQVGERLVTFTFDDGPSPATTPAILRLLEKYGVRATFFLIGRYLDGDTEHAEAAREVVRQIVRAGHAVGNHTHDHEQLTAVPHTRALAQMDDGAASIERVTGRRPVFFRPPYGSLDPFTQQAIAERAWELVLWSVESQDMLANDPIQLAASLEGQLEYNGGGIILLHDVKPSTVAALPRLLAWLDERKYDPAHPETPGYRIVDLAEYLRATSQRPQPFPNRAALEEARKVEYVRMRTEAKRRGVPMRPLVQRTRSHSE